MRRTSALLLLLAQTSCSSHGVKQDAAGWTYMSQGYRNNVQYNFADSDQIRFTGTCDFKPTFLLTGGLPDGTIQVRVDQHSWPFGVIQGEHGRGIIIEQPLVVEAIGRARRLIAFEAPGWRRQIKPNDLLQRFIEECVARRKIDPTADRYFDSSNLITANGK